MLFLSDKLGDVYNIEASTLTSFALL